MDIEPAEGLDRFPRGEEPRIRRARRELVRVVPGPGVQAVEETLVTAVPPLRHETVHDRALVEGDVLGVPGEGEEHGAAGVLVDAHELDRVRAGPHPVIAPVTAEEEDVVTAVGGVQGRAVGEDRGESGPSRGHRGAGVGDRRGDEHEDDGGDGEPPPGGHRLAVRAAEPPGVDEDEGPDGRPPIEHPLGYGEEPRRRDESDDGRETDERDEPEGDDDREQSQPDPQHDASDRAVAGHQLRRSGQDDAQREEGDRTAARHRAAHVGAVCVVRGRRRPPRPCRAGRAAPRLSRHHRTQ